MMTSRRGFTLYELIVAMAIAVVLMGIIYAIYIRAARTYRVQNMAIEMQSRARFGLEHLRRDVANAGFNGATNTSQDPNICFAPNGNVSAITLRRSPLSDSVVNPSANTNIQPLEFTLFGDYAGQGQVFYTESIVGTQVTLQSGFELPGPDGQPLVTQQEFEHIFDATGGTRRYVRIVEANQYEMLIPITGNNYSARTLTLAQAPPQLSGAQACGVQGFGQGLPVNSAMYIRYRIVISDPETGKTDLVREELDINRNTLPGSRLTVAEYAVDLSAYDFVFDTDETGGLPTFSVTALPDVTIVDASGTGGALGTLSNTSQDLRFMTLKLTVRSSDEDPDHVHQERVPNRMLRSYEVFEDLQGSARALTMTSKTMLHTLAMRNI